MHDVLFLFNTDKEDCVTNFRVYLVTKTKQKPIELQNNTRHLVTRNAETINKHYSKCIELIQLHKNTSSISSCKVTLPSQESVLHNRLPQLDCNVLLIHFLYK